MAYATIVMFFCHSVPQTKTFLSGFSILWGQLLSVTTFTLTFFVNQSYALWRKCYEMSRRLQGRLHDINLILAAHAVRKPPTNPYEPSTYTAASRQVLALISRYTRLFNVLTYGSFTRSHRPILTPRGMRRLVERGLMTPTERQVLVDAEIPATQRHTAVMLWILRTYVEGRQAGHFLGGDGFESQLLEKFHVLRAQYGGIGDELQGRMPFAYAHIVQVLVDIILWMYPWMAYSAGMSPFIAIIGTGLLTVSYQGLFDLAKQFLDPYDNESYGKGEDPLVVDTLIAETNAGSVRWINGLEEYPVGYDSVSDGDLSEYLLPIRGYTVEEVEAREIEKVRKEEEEADRRAKEAADKLREELEAQILQKAAEAMVPAQVMTTGIGTGVLSKLEISVQPNPLVSKGLRPPRMSKSSKLETAIATVNILSAMPMYGDSIASDILPDGLPLVADAEVPRPMITNSHKTAVSKQSLKSNNVNRVNGSKGDSDVLLATTEPSVVVEKSNGQPSPSETAKASLPKKTVGPTSNEDTSILDDDIVATAPTTSTATETFSSTGISTYEEFLLKEAALRSAIQEEMLETEQILAATPGSVNTNADIGDQSATEQIITANNETTVASKPTESSKLSAKQRTEIMLSDMEDEAEKIETEAILNAPPAADSIEVLEKDDYSASLLANTTRMNDDLAILEMDVLDENDELLAESNTTFSFDPKNQIDSFMLAVEQQGPLPDAVGMPDKLDQPQSDNNGVNGSVNE